MANLTATQKKQKNAFTLMLVAIIIVAAAIGYVVFGEISSKSSLFENQKFAAAISENLEKAPAFVTEADLASLKCLAFSYDAETETASVTTMGKDFDAKRFIDLNNTLTDYEAQYAELIKDEEANKAAIEALTQAANEANNELIALTSSSKTASFQSKEAPNLDDIKYLTGLELVEVYGAKFTDSSVFSGMTNIVSGAINSCGLTEVSGFASLDAEKLDTLSIIGNNIEDWSALDYVKDKVIVEAYQTIVPNEDGTFDMSNLQYVEKTLADYYEEKAAEEAEDETSEDAGEETSEPEAE